MAVKIKMGAKAEIKGERTLAAPRALNTANANQKTMEIPMAIPIPKSVPLFPMRNEKGIAINTMIKLDRGKAYLYCNLAWYFWVSAPFSAKYWIYDFRVRIFMYSGNAIRLENRSAPSSIFIFFYGKGPVIAGCIVFKIPLETFLQ